MHRPNYPYKFSAKVNLKWSAPRQKLANNDIEIIRYATKKYVMIHKNFNHFTSNNCYSNNFVLTCILKTKINNNNTPSPKTARFRGSRYFESCSWVFDRRNVRISTSIPMSQGEWTEKGRRSLLAIERLNATRCYRQPCQLNSDVKSIKGCPSLE